MWPTLLHHAEGEERIETPGLKGTQEAGTRVIRSITRIIRVGVKDSFSPETSYNYQLRKEVGEADMPGGPLG